MATDTTSGKGAGEGGRRPTTIDLAAEEVDTRREPSGEPSGEGLAGDADDPGFADRRPGETFPDASSDTLVGPDGPGGLEPAPDDSDPAVLAAAGDEPALAWAGSEPDSRKEPAPTLPDAAQTVRTRDQATVARLPRREGKAGFGSLLLAALLGGLVSAGGMFGLERAGLLGMGRGDPEPPPDWSGAIAGLQGELASLKQAGEQAAPAPDLTPLQSQIATLSKAVEALNRQPAVDPAERAALQAVEGRIAALEQAEPGADPGLDLQVKSLSEAVDAIRNAPPEPDTTGPVLAALRTRLDDTAKRLDAVEDRPQVNLAGVEQAITSLRDQGMTLSSRLDAAATAAQVKTLQTQVEATGRQVELSAALGPAVAADALAAALEAGTPFKAELDALRALGLDAEALAALEPHAAAGLPTLAALRAGFEGRVAAVDLTTPIPASAGALDRLLQSARGLVEVRRAEATGGADPAAVAARLRAALEAEDLQGALTERDALPDPAQAATAEWARSAEARLAAERLVARLRAEALSRLASQG